MRFENNLTTDPPGAIIYAGKDYANAVPVGITPLIGPEPPYDRVLSRKNLWEEDVLFFKKAGYKSSDSYGYWVRIKAAEGEPLTAPTFDGLEQVIELDLHVKLEPQDSFWRKHARNRPRKDVVTGNQSADALALDELSMTMFGSLERLDEQARVTTAGAAVYQYPCTESDRAATLRQFSAVRVLGSLPSGWTYVQHSGKGRGWVHSLALNKDFEHACLGGCRDFEAELSPIFQQRRAAAAMLAMKQRAAAEKRARQEAIDRAREEAEERARAAQPMINDSNTFLGALQGALDDFNNSMPDPLDLSTSRSSLHGDSTYKLSADDTAASSDYPYPGESYTFTCPDGNKFTMDIPSARSKHCNDVLKRFAVVQTCNLANDIPAANAEFMQCQ